MLDFFVVVAVFWFVFDDVVSYHSFSVLKMTSLVSRKSVEVYFIFCPWIRMALITQLDHGYTREVLFVVCLMSNCKQCLIMTIVAMG